MKLKKILNWYFSRRSLPYWCILLIDCFIVFLSALFVYWMFSTRRSLELRWEDAWHTIVLYLAICLIGFRIFHTYSGVFRYASFVDIKKVVFANLLNMALAIAVSQWIYYSDITFFLYFYIRHTITIFITATLLMCLMRVMVKVLYEVEAPGSKALRVMIYGTMDDGIGLGISLVLPVASPVSIVYLGSLREELHSPMALIL